MTVLEVKEALGAHVLTQGTDLTRTVNEGYSCDLLSWVMAHGQEGMAWVTVQIHMNVIAVAALHDMACVIMPESIRMEKESIEKAVEEGICVLESPLSGYEICGRLHAAGVPDKD